MSDAEENNTHITLEESSPMMGVEDTGRHTKLDHTDDQEPALLDET